MTNQRQYIKKALKFFGVKIDDITVDNKIMEIQSIHSKSHSETYGTDQREQHFRKIREQLSSEIDSGVKWALQTFGVEILSDLDYPLINE